MNIPGCTDVRLLLQVRRSNMGNHLGFMSEPDWMVTSWPAAIECDDAIIEGFRNVAIECFRRCNLRSLDPDVLFDNSGFFWNCHCITITTTTASCRDMNRIGGGAFICDWN